MFRRAVLVSSVLGVVSAAGALAFAPELARAGRALSSRSPWRARGFTPAPASLDGIHGPLAATPGQPADSTPGEYCRFPTNTSTGPALHAPDPALPGAVDSALDLSAEGQSRVPRMPREAICTGTAPGSISSDTLP